MDAQPALTERAFSRRAVEAVREAGTPPHVSLFLPTCRAWNQAKENRLTFRDLVQGADDALQGRGVSQADSEALLQPARDLVDKDAFWREATDGLALFIAPDHLSSIRLPFRPSPLQYVDRRFHIRPLWRHVEPDGRFYVLALSQGGIRLYRASRYAAEGVPLKDVPTTLGEALQFDEHIRSVLFHTKTRPGASGDSFKRAAMYFGQEDAGDKAYLKEGIVRFFQELDGEVCRLLGQEATPPPLVLAGVEYIRGLYRKASQYAHLVDAGIEGPIMNWAADEWDTEALHARGWPLVASLFDQKRADATARYEQLASTDPGRTATGIEAVVPAAYDHRIDVLFVAEPENVWGRYNAVTRSVTAHDHAHPMSTELMNAVTVHTLEGQGTAHVTDASDVPGASTAAAILRY